LKEKNNLLLMELYGIPPPTDIRLLSEEYIRQKEVLTPQDSPEFDEFNGIKLRASWEKESKFLFNVLNLIWRLIIL